ncbi:MAG: NUDIX hydrolase YfcD [Desulfobulbaceae bacterium]|nr:NUDIX hydrolase YfcD [Desulfobulbaceae bacterium]
MNPRDEEVAIVDANNRVTGSAPRHEMRARGLIHRATYILVFNRRGELFVQERTKSKDIYPGYFDVATGGVVLAGESYEESAARELAEEIGAEGVALQGCFDFYHQDAGNKVWGRLFTCVYDGPITLQAAEVADGFFMAVDEVLKMADSRPFTPDGLLVLRRHLAERDG